MNCKSLVILLFASLAFAETKALEPLKVWFADGSCIEIHSESTGANSPASNTGSIAVAGNDSRRLVFDKNGKLLLGYDIEARKTGQDTYTVRVKPMDGDHFKTREFPPLRAGDAVELDILYDPATGERIYDVLKISNERPPSRTSTKPAGEQFSLQEWSVVINGRTLVQQQGTWMLAGSLRIYLPGRGEFYLALAPGPDVRFQASGWVDHNVLRFFTGTELVEVTGRSNVLQKSDYSTVWVYHVPDAPRWAAAGRGVELTGADEVESLLGKNRK